MNAEELLLAVERMALAHKAMGVDMYPDDALRLINGPISLDGSVYADDMDALVRATKERVA